MESSGLRFWSFQEVYLSRIFLPILIGSSVLFIGLAALFAFCLFRQHYRLWHLGNPENRYDRVWSRLRTVFTVTFLHLRFWKEGYPGTMHFLIFYGALLILTGKIVRIFSYPIGLTNPPQPLFLYASFLSEAGGVLLLIGGGMAILRRYIMKPSRLETKPDRTLVFIWGFVLLMTGYLIKGYRITAPGVAAPPDWPYWAPISYPISRLMLILPTEPLNELFIWHRIFIHALPVFILFAYVTVSHSPLQHLFLSPINIFFRSLKPKGGLAPIPNFDEAETFGVREIPEFTWKQLLDLEACTNCGRCQDACPAHLSQKPLSPRRVIQNLKEHLWREGPKLLNTPAEKRQPRAITETTVSEDELWACTFCLNCQEQCPVFISAYDKIIEMRRSLVLMESRYPSELRDVFRNMERRGNPWGAERHLRDDWASDLGVKTLQEDPEVELLYFPGCFKGYDDRNKKVAISMVKILQRAEVKFGILGKEEGCCGDPARRIGNEYLYKMMVESNIETMNRYQVRRILTTCPHCFNTLKNEYPQFGGTFEVLHQTEFLSRLLKEKRLSLKGLEPATVTYHDSCYLGRYNGIYEEPRKILTSIPGLRLREMERSRAKSFCCGGGGGRMWMEEHLGKRINEMRTDQALEQKTDVIATACPYCLTMLSDGVKTRGVEDRVRVLDIAELLEKSLSGESKKN